MRFLCTKMLLYDKIKARTHKVVILMDIYKIMEDIAEENNGIIRTKDVVNAGVRREVLARLVEEGILDKESRGIYVLSGEWLDEYAFLQKKYPQCIFSYGTALYFWGLSGRLPDPISVSVPQGYNASCIKRMYAEIQVHFVRRQWWETGITETNSPQGGKLKVYDRERCICDLVRDKEKIELQVYTQALRDYFRSDKKDIRRLLKYADFFSIEKIIRSYMEVLL